MRVTEREMRQDTHSHGSFWRYLSSISTVCPWGSFLFSSLVVDLISLGHTSLSNPAPFSRLCRSALESSGDADNTACSMVLVILLELKRGVRFCSSSDRAGSSDRGRSKHSHTPKHSSICSSSLCIRASSAFLPCHHWLFSHTPVSCFCCS